MKVIRFHAYGDADVLRYEDTDRPVPAAGQVLIKVAGTSFNPADAAIRAGYLRDTFALTLPHTPGLDVAGTITELGEGVTGHAVGDPVIGFLPMDQNGATAEFVVAPAEILAAAPASLPLADAAALPAVALTAWQAIHEHLQVRAGRRVLINGASGGVGRYAVQFAKLAGGYVIGTAGPGHLDVAGADEMIDYTRGPVTAEVDAVLNTAAADEATMAGLVALVRPGVIVVSLTTPAPEDAERKVRTMNMYVRSDATQLAEIARLVDAGEVTVPIGERHPFAETAAVHRRAAAGDLHGKVVLTPQGS
jgi:NADPH:quinone reductase-like Zn-dependent oxidoreductase